MRFTFIYVSVVADIKNVNKNYIYKMYLQPFVDLIKFKMKFCFFFFVLLINGNVLFDTIISYQTIMTSPIYLVMNYLNSLLL